MRYSTPAVIFEPRTHIYRTPAGKLVPSVTQIIRGDKPTFYKDTGARERGVAIHKMTEAYEAGTLIPEYFSREVLGYLDPFKDFLASQNYKELILSEAILSHCPFPGFMYAGIVDRIYLEQDDTWVFLDIKTGKTYPPDTDLQLAAYVQAQTLYSGTKVKRVCLRLSSEKWYKKEYPAEDLELDTEVFNVRLRDWYSLNQPREDYELA